MNAKVKKSAIVLAGNVFVLLLVSIVFLFGLIGSISNSLYDFTTRNAMTHQPDGDILLVTIDSESLEKVGAYPWDRKVYSQLIETIEKGGAKAIAFDIELYTESNNKDSDAVLAQTLSKYNNVIIPSHADLENKFTRSTMIKKNQLIKAETWINPIPIFKTVPAHINAAFDDDGVIRRNWLQINSNKDVYNSFAYQIADLGGYDVKQFSENLQEPESNHPKSEILIKYDANQKDFENIPFFRVLNNEIPPSVFKDRLVLVGYTAPGSDQGITPIEKHMNLIYVHANILNQIINDNHISQVPRLLLFILVLLFALAIALLTSRLKSPILSIALTLAIVALSLYAQHYLFSNKLIVFDSAYIIFAVILSYLINIAIKTFFEIKHKNFITSQFGRYISPDLVKDIALKNREIELGGVNKELSILFLDIRGFTSLSEKLTPQEVVEFLNLMFNLITEKALENNGTIDKFIGDAAMIIYNAPLDVEDHEYRAVKTAIDIQAGMAKVREEVQAKYGVVINVGIGINTGEVVVGNIGSYLRVDYTAIGDNVNIAARIESNTVANQILVSESTYDRTKDVIEYNYIGQKTVKGKSVPLNLYEVIQVKNSN